MHANIKAGDFVFQIIWDESVKEFVIRTLKANIDNPMRLGDYEVTSKINYDSNLQIK